MKTIRSVIPSSSILASARKVTSSVIFPLLAVTGVEAATYLDYSAGATYSNSGWFTGVFDSGVASGSTLGNGFKLSGTMSGTDHMFWGYSEYWDAQAPLLDTTGVAMVWGGRITGATSYDDTIEAPFDFTTMFDQTLRDEYDSASTYVILTLGYSNSAFTPEQWSGGPASNASNYSERSFSYNSAGSYQELGTISVGLEETDAYTDLYWFVQLELQLNHEYAAHWTWAPDNVGAYATRNGDAFSLSVPQNSIDFAYVPEPSSFSVIFAMVAVVMAGLRRRQG
jgi:hypothetical protein